MSAVATLRGAGSGAVGVDLPDVLVGVVGHGRASGRRFAPHVTALISADDAPDEPRGIHLDQGAAWHVAKRDIVEAHDLVLVHEDVARLRVQVDLDAVDEVPSTALLVLVVLTHGPTTEVADVLRFLCFDAPLLLAGHLAIPDELDDHDLVFRFVHFELQFVFVHRPQRGGRLGLKSFETWYIAIKLAPCQPFGHEVCCSTIFSSEYHNARSSPVKKKDPVTTMTSFLSVRFFKASMAS